MSFVLDTCVLVDHLRNVEPSTRFLATLPAAAISTITWMELLVGARDAREEQAIRAFLSAYAVLAMDEAVAEAAVRVRRELRVTLPDAIMLATARVHGRQLATRNTRDFPPATAGVFVPYTLT